MSVITDANHKEYKRAIEMLTGQGSNWAYDVESDGLDVRNGNIIGFGISNGLKGFYFCHQYWEDGKLQEALTKEECLVILNLLKNKKLIMWNGSFDCRFTYHYFGVDLVPSLYIEGMLAKHCLDELPPFKLKLVGKALYGEEAVAAEKDLNETIRAMGGKPGADIYRGDKDLVGKYCIQDCHLTFRIAFHYVTKMDKQLENFFFKDEVMPLYKEVTIPMESLGVPIDTKGLAQQQADIAADIKELEDQIQTLILPLLKDVFEPWYLQKTYYPKRTGPFAQALCKYADLPLPHTGSGAYSLARKALESLEDSVYKKFLLGEAHLFISDVTKIQKSMISGYMFNLQSNHHLKKLFFETLKEESISKTPTGQPQVNDEFVDVMGMKYEWARLLIEYNKLTKIKGTYIDRFLNEADNGVFYPSFKQHGTISGRYSSDLQQLPRPLEESQASSLVRKYNNELRKNFISGDTHVFIDSDYESLEPHVFAHVSGDKRLTDIFHSGCDFYSTIAIIAEKLNGVSALKKDNNYLGRTQKLTRQNAKDYALGIPYGLGDYGLAKLIDINQSTAKSIIETYLNSYPQLREWMKRTDERVRTIGIIASQAGRVRHLDHAPIIWKENGPIILDGLKLWKKWNGSKKYEEKKEDSRKMKKALKQGKNFQIQSLAASITNRACIAIARELKRKGVDGHVCAQIHDQIIVRVPKDMAETWRKSVQFIMENAYKLSIPLKAPAEIAHNFYEGH